MEPERKIEKILHAFAKKRRDQAGAPGELHPSARRRLQAEVSKLASRKGGEGSFFSLFSRFRPRLVFALCFVAVASIGAWLLLPLLTARNPQTLASAKRQRANDLPAEQAKATPPPAPVFSAAPLAEGGNKKTFADNGGVVTDNGALQPGQPDNSAASPAVRADRKIENSPANPTEQLAVALDSNDLKLKPVNGPESGVTQAGSLAGTTPASMPPINMETPASTAAVPVDSFAIASPSDKEDSTLQPLAPSQATKGIAVAPATLAANNQETQTHFAREKAPAPVAPSGAAYSYDLAKAETAAAPTVSQRFYRTDAPATRQRSAVALSGAVPVLASFRVEQSGSEIRVLDADGSVYTGVLQLVSDETDAVGAMQDGAQRNSPALKTAQNQQATAAQSYSFRVAGTNRNWKQNLVFSGNFIPLTNALLARTNPATIGGFGGGVTAGVRRVAAEPTGQNFLSNLRISGKAVIGEQKEIEINAAPAH